MTKNLFLPAFLVTGLIAGGISQSTLAQGEGNPGARVLTAQFTDRAGPNAYQVTFPQELGGQDLTLPITGGQFELEVNAATGSSRLISWRQDIAPIDIMGASTGPIVVRIDDAQPSSGSYDAQANTFAVTASFILEFDDSQLRNFGFASPFVLSATEEGRIYGVATIGKIQMSLSGDGVFGLGQFKYSCKTSAEFLYNLPEEKGQPGDVNHDHLFDVSDPIACLVILFQGSKQGCPGAIEVNGDGKKDVSDAIYLFQFLFQGGNSPPFDPVDCAADVPVLTQ